MATQGEGKWIVAGGGCLVGGGLIALATGRSFWFAAGALLGAGVVGARLYDRSAAKDETVHRQRNRFAPDRTNFGLSGGLGAPEIPAVDQPMVPAAGETLTKTRATAGSGYPMMNRVPDVEVHMDTMDDFIRPHFTGPLGPENDPVRYWSGGGSGVNAGSYGP
jgi:hypothetical protein